MKNMLKMAILTVFIFTICGCLSLNLNLPTDNGDRGSGEAETVLLANTNNVYRLATNTILRVRIQQDKNGKWVESKERVLIPENWFIVSGDGL